MLQQACKRGRLFSQTEYSSLETIKKVKTWKDSDERLPANTTVCLFKGVWIQIDKKIDLGMLLQPSESEVLIDPTREKFVRHRSSKHKRKYYNIRIIKKQKCSRNVIIIRRYKWKIIYKQVTMCKSHLYTLWNVDFWFWSISSKFSRSNLFIRIKLFTVKMEYLWVHWRLNKSGLKKSCHTVSFISVYFSLSQFSFFCCNLLLITLFLFFIYYFASFQQWLGCMNTFLSVHFYLP